MNRDWVSRNVMGYVMECLAASILKKCRLLGFILIFSAPAVGAQEFTQEPYTLLQKYIGCSKSDLAALKRGEPLVKIMPAGDPIEIAVFGAVRVKVPAEFFLQKYRNIGQFKRAKEVKEIGKFSQPPRLEDIEALTLDQKELDSLRDCTVGSCGMKLTSAMIAQLREVDWSKGIANQQATALFRNMLLENVENYLAQGNAALAVYSDKNPPVQLRKTLETLVQESPYLEAYDPDLERYLLAYPNSHPAASESFIYWSKEEFGVKPVVSVTHVTVDRPSGPLKGSLVFASKQIYANHYFTGSLALGAFTPVPGGGSQGEGYLMYLNRSRVDLLGGFLNFMRRWVLNRRLRQGMEENLSLLKKRLETEYQSPQ